MTFVAIILAGGQGERFWPLSTAERPKQFLDLEGHGRSLLQTTVERLSNVAASANVYIQTSEALAAATAAHVTNFAAGRILAEPARRDTGPALAWSLLQMQARYGNDAVVGYFPADAWIGDQGAFATTVETAVAAAESDASIVLIGIPPTRPATAYGYIETDATSDDSLFKVESFREKPDAATAAEYFESGRYVWNAGMFIARIDVLLDAFANHAPELISPLQQDGDVAYGSLPKISFDYAVMERVNNARVVPAQFEWDDLGDWNAVARFAGENHPLRAVQHQSLNDNETDVLGGSADETVVTIGLDNVVVVRDGKRTLIARRDRLGDLKRR